MAFGLRVSQNVGSGCVSGQEKNSRVGAHFPDLQHGFDSVNLGHHDVGENDVGALLARKLDRVFATVKGNRVEVKAPEDLGQAIGD